MIAKELQMKLICSLLLAGSISAFAQETPTTPAPAPSKGITQDAPAPKPHKGHKKGHKKHHGKKQQH